MTAHARDREELAPARCVALDRLELWNALALELTTRRVTSRQKREVGDDVPHVAPGRIERLAVHAALEAIVDPVLEEIDVAAPRARDTACDRE